MHLVSSNRKRLSPYVTLVARTVDGDQGEQVYHALEQADYVSVLAVTPDKKVPLVRQYRPAVERETIELPGGLLDFKTTPDVIARNELFEETGYDAPDGLVSLGCLDPDTGRLGNRFWGFFADNVTPSARWTPEAGLKVELLTLGEFIDMIKSGQFGMALHVALVGMAILRGLISMDDLK
jgi:ADP-ribose pyrophosphatase